MLDVLKRVVCQAFGVVFSVTFMVVVAADSFSQASVKQEVFRISNQDDAVVDLSGIASRECTAEIQKEIAGSYAIVRFQPKFRPTAEKIAEKLIDVLNELQKNLAPLKVGNLKLYMLQMDGPPSNHRFVDVDADDTTYFDIVPFTNENELSLENCANSAFCQIVFNTFAHEMTHMVVDGLISPASTRWLDDGLASFVGYSVLDKFAPVASQSYYISSAPEVILYRLRNKIFDWKHETASSFKETGRSDFSYYVASHQLIRGIIEESKKKGVYNPLRLLITKLQLIKETTGKPVDSKKSIEIVREYLRVDPITIGDIDLSTRTKLIEEAISLLSQRELSPDRLNRAMTILSALEDQISLPPATTERLLDEIYGQRNNDLHVRQLAATALVVRYRSEDFDKILRRYSSKNSILRKSSLKNLKKEIFRLSIQYN